MNSDPEPWALPGLGRWIEDLVRRLDHGLAVLPRDPTRPPDVLGALRLRLRVHPTELNAVAGQSPAASLADAFGTAPKLEALLTPVLDQEIAIIGLTNIAPDDVAAWSVFFQRFADARASGCGGPALLVVDPPTGLNLPKSAPHDSWRAGLRRGDLVIWAEEHLPTTRDGLAADFAVQLAVDLCAWRLDLAAALVRAGLDDLAEPVGWLSRRTEPPILGAEPMCPIAVLAEKRHDVLFRRIWKAQLAALYPALESWRLEVVAKHASRLQVDDHLRKLGVESIEEIEFGALRFQLRGCLNRTEAERLELLSRARNALAHRQPVRPDDALHLLR